MATLIYGGSSYPLAADTTLQTFEQTIIAARNQERSNGVVPFVTFNLASSGSITVNADRAIPIALSA